MMEVEKEQPWGYFGTDWSVERLTYSLGGLKSGIKGIAEHYVGEEKKRGKHMNYFMCFLEIDGEKMHTSEMFCKEQEDVPAVLSVILVDFLRNTTEDYCSIVGVAKKPNGGKQA